MKWLVMIAIIVLACGGFAWWFLAQPGPKQLDMVNNIVPGDSDARLLVQDQPYDDELGLGLNIWTPETLADEPLPVVVFIYGGGWRAGAKDQYAFAGRALANRGYMVVLPDYRLFPNTRFPGFLEDSAKALAWVHDNIATHGGDPERIFLSGQSAGAYNAMMLALDRQWLGREGKTPDLIRGVAALAGPYDFYPFDSETTKQSFGEYPDPEMTQPVNFVRADAPPLWLSSGSNDTQVRPRNSRILRDRILAAGGDAEYVEYPDIDHLEIMMALAKPFRHKAPVLDDMVAFFDRHK
ncbi:alpha/beta hydrolase [Sphingopyxis sp. BSNA05]|uniref:alpha/beta hydrolase n=1 Tax=Sphingopyxis sp. BSNA05 TaxID=1236614 RepID=UPI0015648073|nr:alpha/beta hydrolase [Sphingopyxis sp. BSNA05]NRD88762.1 alpha/beta hydrolase [Sphingopyxis sp. BSNA05]